MQQRIRLKQDRAGEDSRLGLWIVRSQQDMISAVAGVKHKPSDNEVVGASAVISEWSGMERDYKNHFRK